MSLPTTRGLPGNELQQDLACDDNTAPRPFPFKQEMNMQNPHQGSCLCGAVTYQVHGELKAVTHCHCRKCRKGHGAAFATYASTLRAHLAIDDPGAALKAYESSPGVLRQFCGQCGSSLFWHNAGGQFADWLSIAIATLDTVFTAPRQKHHCVATKADWHTITDQFPQQP